MKLEVQTVERLELGKVEERLVELGLHCDENNDINRFLIVGNRDRCGQRELYIESNVGQCVYVFLD